MSFVNATLAAPASAAILEISVLSMCWDNSIGRTVGTNQNLIHQYFSTSGDTYWVQMATTLSPAGTKVTINDTAPTADRYNLSICEILP